MRIALVHGGFAVVLVPVHPLAAGAPALAKTDAANSTRGPVVTPLSWERIL